MSKLIDQSMSRRSFSSDVAKLVGLGAFAHFSLVGSVARGKDAASAEPAAPKPDDECTGGSKGKDPDACPSGEVGVDVCNDTSTDKCVGGEAASDECMLTGKDPDECPGGFHSVDTCPGGASPEDECPGGQVEKDLCPDGSAAADECAGGGCAGGDQDIGANTQDVCTNFPADKPHRE
jgi:hypothetical protein